MAKVSKKSEKITAFGGIFFVLDKFDRILSSVIDSHLGLCSKLIGYQYSEIIRAANFYRYIVALPLMAVLFGIKATENYLRILGIPSLLKSTIFECFPQKYVNLHYASAFFFHFMHSYSAISLYLQQKKYNNHGYYAY